MTEATRAERCVVLVGPYTAGKTTLMEALLFATGAVPRKGSVAAGTAQGDASPEARARQMTTEPNIAHFDYLGDPWAVIDCPGSVELSQDTRAALMVADVAVVVAEPDPARAAGLQPLLRHLDDLSIPHLIFVNRIDKAAARVRDILAALQAASSRPLVLREVPIRDGEQVTGYVDLVSERAWHFQENQPSNLVDLPEAVKPRESEARQELLEALADFDDGLMEQLLEDRVPARAEVYAQLARDLQQDLIVPVFIGSAEHGNGIVRLLKALRHEAPPPAVTAERLGLPADAGFCASVAKTLYQPHTGKLSVLRIWQGSLREGQSLGGERPAGLYRLRGGEVEKLREAEAGMLVAASRCAALRTGDLLLGEGARQESGHALWPAVPQPVYALAVRPLNRQDDVKLTGAIAKLIEEDPSLSLEHNADTHQMLLWGQGEIHLQVAVERLKNRFNVAVAVDPPQVAYKETIRRSVEQHARFKRQSGGHGQFADVKVAFRPLERGQGFVFEDAIVGGAIPRQFVSSVEAGLREGLARGPLGFPVVDVRATLHDGQFHSVDSSDNAFRTAGRMALSEALPQGEPVLLEPIFEVTVEAPSEGMSRVNGLVSARRGQILGFEPKPGWSGWDRILCHLPAAELTDLIVELRSLTQGAGSFTWRFDRLQELVGRPADKVVQERQQAAQ